MAFAQLDVNSAVTALYTGRPEPDPGVVEIADDDARIAAFLARVAVLLAPKPTPREWLNRLPAGKQAAVAAAARASDSMFLWFMKAAGAAYIDVAGQETIDGVNALVGAGVLATDDAGVLLAP